MFLLIATVLLGQTIPELKSRDHNHELTHGWSSQKAEVKLWIEHVESEGEPVSLVFWYPCTTKTRKKITYKNEPIFVMIGNKREKQLPLRFSNWVSGKSFKNARLFVDNNAIGNEIWIYTQPSTKDYNYESLVQAITWQDFLAMANASQVSGYAGDAHFKLGERELDAIRDMASRLARDESEVDAFFGESMRVPYGRMARFHNLIQECRSFGKKAADEGPSEYGAYRTVVVRRIVFLARKFGHPEDADAMIEASIVNELDWKRIQKNRS